MDDKRAQTLQALSEFIQAQRALLTRTQSDIGRLNELRSRIISQPIQVANHLAEELDGSAFRFSDQKDCQAELPGAIDWSVYEKYDPAPIQALRQRQQRQPHAPSPPSNLQEFVRQSRATILDPIFARLNLSFDPQPEPEEIPEPDPATIKKTKEQEKIRELKKRKIVSSGLTYTGQGSGYRVRGPGGVFVRRDLADESMDVDISPDDNSKQNDPSFPPCVDVEMSMSTASSNSPPPPPTPVSCPKQKSKPKPRTRNPSTLIPPPPMVLTKSPRVRRPSVKAANDARPKGPTIIIPALSSARRQIRTIDCNASSTPPPPPPQLPLAPSVRVPAPESSSTSPEPEPISEDENDAPASILGKRARESESKPDTYKKAWSSSEQHLLERLLEQIPDGQKNRWKKISEAMNGRRTPRQVASRVQKYYEKLKRFGINVDD
uniref:Uncharacterized protein n=1 Tax=Moniliophthora roreri TaxID=221103 RepID=A0A0W0FXF9_MONRR